MTDLTDQSASSCGARVIDLTAILDARFLSLARIVIDRMNAGERKALKARQAEDMNDEN